MKSITIHGMDHELASRLERQARESGLSLNKAIKKLLAGVLGVPPAGPIDRRRNFEDLCGIWSKQEAKVFKGATREFERADPEDWV